VARVLAIPDLHIPFHNERALSFLKKTYKQYKCDTVVCLGDEVDFHGLSFHDIDPDLPSAGDEYRYCLKELKKFYKAFPEVKVCISNHTSRPFRRAFKFGLPSQFIRSYSEFLQAPKTWEWKNEWVIDDVMYIHGDPASGKYASLKLSEGHRRSVVHGHVHSFGGVTFSATKKDQIFGMNAGCLIDVEHRAFAYAKNLLQKPTLGCGVVINGKMGIFVPL